MLTFAVRASVRHKRGPDAVGASITQMHPRAPYRAIVNDPTTDCSCLTSRRVRRLQAAYEAKIPVGGAGVDLEGVECQVPDLAGEVFENASAPLAALRPGGVVQGFVVGLQPRRWVDQPVEGRQSLPAVTGTLDISAAASEEGGGVEGLRLPGRSRFSFFAHPTSTTRMILVPQCPSGA
jgi:hypothetical protein